MAHYEDPGLFTLVEDVKRLVYGLCFLLELMLSASYVTGKLVVEWSIWVGLCIWEYFCNTADGLRAVLNAVIEFEESCIRGIALLHYGIAKICEAFQVTSMDFASFLQQVQTTHIQLFDAFLNSVLKTIDLLIVTVPQHIFSALSIIGDFGLDIVIELLKFVQHFIFQLIWSPINAAMAISSLGIRAAALPVQLISVIPFSAHFGSIIILLVYILFCKLSFMRFVNLLTVFFATLFRAVRQVPYIFNEIRKLLAKQFIIFHCDPDVSNDMKAVCVICQNNTVSYLANPCNHVCLCSTCVRQVVQFDNRCPMCRNEVDHYAKVYVS